MELQGKTPSVIKFKVVAFVVAVELINENAYPLILNHFITDESESITYRFMPLVLFRWDKNKYSLITRRNGFFVYSDGKHELRVLKFEFTNQPYAIYEEIDNKRVNIYFSNHFLPDLKLDTVFFSCFALERHLYHQHCYIFHCAYLDFNGKAILFSGNSGVGKSTQAALWCKQFSDESILLNGDRTLISRESSDYYANGWPVCGSSEVCFNARRKIACIVFLGQSPVNQIIELRVSQKIKAVTAQTTINYWNPDFLNHAIDQISDLVQHIPVVSYNCTMADDAPIVLHNYLAEKKWI